MVMRHGLVRPSLRRRAAASFLALLCSARELHADETPVAPSERTPTPRASSPYAAGAEWAVAQLIPSPLLVVGKRHVGGGLRWQLTPLSYSFGIAERPVRSFFVSPIARHSGSVELHVSPEWACCAPGDASSWLVRAGLRLYLPLIEHGEQLSWSLGAAYYRAAGDNGASADLGLLTFNGVLGLNLTVSPWLARREVITALTLRYF
ncbi:MAG: hypothetical protein ABUL62_27215 [Myxococcales bacterium]|jgi:hypothetical protein